MVLWWHSDIFTPIFTLVVYKINGSDYIDKIEEKCSDVILNMMHFLLVVMVRTGAPNIELQVL